MKKSPGKWIKTVLFGKKSSKSHLAKAAAKAPVKDLDGNSPVVSDLPLQSTDRDADNTELAKGISVNTNSSVENQELGIFVPVPVSDAEMKRQEEAATKAQAAFRGYLARRAFWALKGIIRLQALIRGHLVRRQAVATLRCMGAIVKIQALARGQKVRLAYNIKYNVEENQGAKQVGIAANVFLGPAKFSRNAFVRKLLASSPTAMPLSLQYDATEPNSAWNWLERWSISNSSEQQQQQTVKPKRKSNAKPQKKVGGAQIVDSEKSKKSVRKVSNGDNGNLSSLESKRIARKVTTPQTETTQEQPQNELEKVKRNLRKITASAAIEKPETETEKSPHRSNEITLDSDIPGQKLAVSSENTATIPDASTDLLETPSKIIVMDEPVQVTPGGDQPFVEPRSSESNGKIDDSSSKETQKIKKKRNTPQPKQEYTENISQNNNTPISLPSYMAATESAKAKLKAQGASSKFEEEGTVEYGYVRRHSLPASTNVGKLSMSSPRVQKPVQSNGKGGIGKSNKALTSSRDVSDKGLQPGWRR